MQVYLIALHKYNQTFWVPTIYIARSQNVRPSPTKKKECKIFTYKTFLLISWFKGTCDREIVDDKAEKCVGVEGLLFLLTFKSSCKRIMVLTFPMLDYDKVCAKYYLMWYGNTGCGVFKQGVQNQKDFCIRINIRKGNY